MSVSYSEHIEGRSLYRDENGRWTATRVYKIYYTNSSAMLDAEYILNNNNTLGLLPPHMEEHPNLSGLYLFDVKLEQEAQLVVATLTYREPDSTRAWLADEEVWEWDVSSQQEHITSVRDSSYVAHYPASDDVGKAIGSHGEDVDGVDVYRPVGSLRISRVWSTFTQAQRRTLMDLRSCTNDRTWFEFYRGEVLFLGAHVSRLPDLRTRVEYAFLISDYVAPYPIELMNGTTQTISPYPWDYVWYEYGDKPETGSGGRQVAKRDILSVHLAQVYDEANFNALALTGPTWWST